MPIGVYPHKSNQGFQKGHKGFITKEGYTRRKRPTFTEEYLEELKDVGRRRGLANKGKSTAKKGKSNPLWSEASKRAWETKHSNPETMKRVHEVAIKAGSKTMALMHGRRGTWIEGRLELILQHLGLVRGEDYESQKHVRTKVSHRYPDFLVFGKIVLEADGSKFHSPEKDAARDIELTDIGLEVHHFIGTDLKCNFVECMDRVVNILGVA
jgi:very-short-patch-repair endonuclease